jgi:hypothetical protein
VAAGPCERPKVRRSPGKTIVEIRYRHARLDDRVGHAHHRIGDFSLLPATHVGFDLPISESRFGLPSVEKLLAPPKPSLKPWPSVETISL